MKKLLLILIVIVVVLFTAYTLLKPQIAKTQNEQKVTLTTGQPVAQIANTQLFVTLDGKVTETPRAGVVQIFLPLEASPSAGTQITEPTSTFVIKLADLLEKSDYRASTIRIIDPTNIPVYDTKDSVAIFTSKKTPQEQVDSLQQVLGKARIDNGKIAKIDLRFDKPVITSK